MFNGIIYKTGTISKITNSNNYSEVVLKTNLKFKNSEIGSSLCCNGTCLTITKIQNNLISFYLSRETLKRTNFRTSRIGDFVNIEKSLQKITWPTYQTGTTSHSFFIWHFGSKCLALFLKTFFGAKENNLEQNWAIILF